MKARGRLPGSRRLLVVALLLTIVALAVELRFVLGTTGGTLFVFTMLAPLCVLAAIALLVVVGVLQYRRENKLFVVERFGPGETIVRQGDPGDGAYFLRAGEVEVVREPEGEVLARLGPGDYFGEMALLTDRPRNATVRSVGDVEAAVVGKRHFLNIMRMIPESEQAVLSTMRDRVLGGGG